MATTTTIGAHCGRSRARLSVCTHSTWRMRESLTRTLAADSRHSRRVLADTLGVVRGPERAHALQTHRQREKPTNPRHKHMHPAPP